MDMETTSSPLRFWMNNIKCDIRKRAWLYTFSRSQGTSPDAMQLACPRKSYSDTNHAAAIGFLPKL